MSKWGNGRGGRPWRRIRDAVLLRDGYTCQQCKRLCLPCDLECDHITPTSKGGTDVLHNLQAMCIPCHERKTLRESGVIEKTPIGLDGWPL